MEKLELKHLAPYLPYDVKLKTNINGNIVFTLNSIILRDFLAFEYEIKPILRPLSDLDNLDDGIVTPKYLQGCCYSYVEYLISQHFDVFGLIDKGLAIDINNIK